MNPILVDVMRGNAIESTHCGALAVLDADGGVVASLGDIERPIFPRSAVKVLQALPLVASGAADRLGLTDDELAIACASHGGEEIHAHTAARMLAKAGLDASALECGAHWPYNEAAMRALAAQGREPSALNNNCSGKHAGFLCLACALHGKADLQQYVRGYVKPEHPVMREVTSVLQAVTGHDLANTPRGIDGCSIPTFAIPLRNLARAFARVGTGAGLNAGHAGAAKRLRAAVAKAPYLVAGQGRFDTRVMERLGARVFCKVGAEGVFCAALPERGLGVAIKIDDGNNARAAEVVMAAVIEAFVTLDDGEANFMRRFSDLALTNCNAGVAFARELSGRRGCDAQSPTIASARTDAHRDARHFHDDDYHHRCQLQCPIVVRRPDVGVADPVQLSRPRATQGVLALRRARAAAGLGDGRDAARHRRRPRAWHRDADDAAAGLAVCGRQRETLARPRPIGLVGAGLPDPADRPAVDADRQRPAARHARPEPLRRRPDRRDLITQPAQ